MVRRNVDVEKVYDVIWGTYGLGVRVHYECKGHTALRPLTETWI